MAEVTRTLRLAASPAAVWATLADFGAISAWAPVVDHSCVLDDGAVGVGTRRRIQSGRTTVIERVTTWEPPLHLAYTLEGLPPVVRSATNRWDVTPDGSGSEVRLTTSVDAGPRPPQQLVARLVARRLAGVNERLLAGLEARCA